MGLPPLEESVVRNGYFDTCVYHQPGIDLLLEVAPSANILFASKRFGAFHGVDPRTGQAFDETRPCVDASRSGDSS
jgi:4-oxalmesaconate hydratase